MVKWTREWTTEVGVQVQDQVSKKESLEYTTVKCVGEGVGMRVYKEGAP